MNRHLHRIVFNAKRGLRMAVSEITTAQGKDGGDTVASGASQLGSDPAASQPWVRPQMFALAGFTLMLLPAALVQAQIIADPTAGRNQQPVVITAGNGVPVVNIQTPTAGGVSMNM